MSYFEGTADGHQTFSAVHSPIGSQHKQEHTMKLQPHDWKTSSFSAGGQCVDVRTTEDAVHVRNSKTLFGSSPNLRFTHGEWSAFMAGVKAGEFG